jgi:prolyl-tRNA synthetase
MVKLQAGTSILGQNFAKAFDVKFANAEGSKNTFGGDLMGVSTRLMGALVTHSDDKVGFTPNLAPTLVIVPIYKTDEQLDEITSKRINVALKS